METSRMGVGRTVVGRLAIAGAAWVLAMAGAASAQNASSGAEAKDAARNATPPEARRPTGAGAPGTAGRRPTGMLRKPLVDLKAQALERRAGQVMPGDGAAAGTTIDQPKPAVVIVPEVRAEAAPPVSSKDPAAKTEPMAPAEPASVRVEASAEKPLATTSRTTTTETNTPKEPRGMEARATSSEAAPEPAPVTRVRAPIAEAAVAEGERTVTPVLTLGGSSVKVIRTSGSAGVQWRSGAANWSAITPGASAEGKVEITAGIDGDVTLLVDERVLVRVQRLARLSVERAQESDGTASVHLTLARGLIEVTPAGEGAVPGASSWLARVRTPDRAAALTTASIVEYDAFSGTRVRMSGAAR